MRRTGQGGIFFGKVHGELGHIVRLELAAFRDACRTLIIIDNEPILVSDKIWVPVLLGIHAVAIRIPSDGLGIAWDPTWRWRNGVRVAIFGT